MPSITNAGGSLTSAIVLTLLAWGVRWLRAELNKKRREEASKSRSARRLGRFYARLSPASLRMLVGVGLCLVGVHWWLSVCAPATNRQLRAGARWHTGSAWQRQYCTDEGGNGGQWESKALHTLPQVEHSVHPHLVFDVRKAPAEPLPSELKGALKLPSERACGRRGVPGLPEPAGWPARLQRRRPSC